MKFFGKERVNIFYSLLVVISCLIIILIRTPANSQNHAVYQISAEIDSVTTEKPDFWLVIGWMINRFYDTAHRKYLTTVLDSQVNPVFKRVIHLAVWGLILIVILSSLGFNISAIIASLGIGGLAFALAAQDTVANLFGGVMLLLQKPIAVGDRIEIDGIRAKVVEIGLRTTVIRELEYDYLIYIPNSKFTSSALIDILPR